MARNVPSFAGEAGADVTKTLVSWSVVSDLSIRCNVLVVEDEEPNRNALVQLLNRLGFSACGAATVAEGLALLDGQHCLILDLNLPDGHGTEVLRQVRAEERSIRVAVYTGSHDDGLLAEAASHHPDGIFAKPLGLVDLLEWLHQSRREMAARER